RDGAPVRARPLTWPRRCLRWVRRRPVLAGLAAVLLVALVGLVAGGGQLYDAELRASAFRRLSDGQRDALDDASARRERVLKEKAAAEQETKRVRLEGRRFRYVTGIREAHEAWKRGQLGRMRELLAGWEQPTDDEPLAGFEHSYLHRLLAVAGQQSFSADE